MGKQFYAHSLEERPKNEWQPLEEHLKETAILSKQFADVLGARDWGYLAGLLHDLGKRTDNGIKKSKAF